MILEITDEEHRALTILVRNELEGSLNNAPLMSAYELRSNIESIRESLAN